MLALRPGLMLSTMATATESIRKFHCTLQGRLSLSHGPSRKRWTF